MSSTTPHLSLNKPDPDELVNVVTQVNNNFDKIDAKALNHSTRLNSVEALAGIAPSKLFTPILRDTAGVAFAGGTNRVGRAVLLGNIAFVHITLTGQITSPATVQPDPRLFLHLPYTPIDPFLLDFQGIADFAGTLMRMNGRYSAFGDRVLMNPNIETGPGNFIKVDDATDVNWQSVTGKFTFTGWYFSTGEELMALTDE